MGASNADDRRLAYTPPAKPLLIATADDTLNALPPGTYDETDGLTSYVSA